MSKFYAIRQGRRTGIVESWDECKELVHGVASQYKSFSTRAAADRYLMEGIGARKFATTPTPPVEFGPSLLPSDVMGRRISSPGPGKAGTRTSGQEILAWHEASELLQTVGADDILCFTAGACRGNPGPCGAGAWIDFPGGVSERSAALGKGTNNIGDLYAVGLAMDLLMAAQQQGRLAPGTQIHVLTDSQYTKGMLSLGYVAKTNHDLITDVKQKMAVVCQYNPVFIHWVAGHSGFRGSELADQLAQQGVRDSQSRLNIVPVTNTTTGKMVFEGHTTSEDHYIAVAPGAKKRTALQLTGSSDDDDDDDEAVGPLDAE